MRRFPKPIAFLAPIPHTRDMNNTTCNYRSSYTDSGDRGADMHEHMRAYHPDHAHVWGDSTYEWEQVGSEYVVWPDRLIRTEAVQRCTICSLRQSDDRGGEC